MPWPLVQFDLEMSVEYDTKYYLLLFLFKPCRGGVLVRHVDSQAEDKN